MAYKDRRSGLLNTEKQIYSGVGDFDIPEMFPLKEVNVEGLESIGFNYMLGEKHPEDKILHFFLDNYQFERVWKEPNKYLPHLQRFKYVIAPDFSLYVDHPKAVQIFNHYRKQWCARYWQDNGVNVIPCICWSDESSFEWCFDGVPKHAPVCISTIGGFGNHGCDKGTWLRGYNKCLEVLEPSQIILFGKEYEETKCEVPTTIIQNAQLKRKATLSAKPIVENSVQIIETKDIDKLLFDML